MTDSPTLPDAAAWDELRRVHYVQDQAGKLTITAAGAGIAKAMLAPPAAPVGNLFTRSTSR